MSSDLPFHFTHLRAHSHYSLLGATASVDQLAQRASADGFHSLALTDRGGLYGAVAFRRACAQVGIRPIIGLTVAVLVPPGEMYPDGLPQWGNLTLLASDQDGYRSLCRLSTRLRTGTTADRSEPALTWDELHENRMGLVCLAGDRTGWLERFIRSGNSTAASRTLGRLGGIFGEACYLTIRPDLLRPDGNEIGAELINLGARFGLRAAAAQPIYCLDESDVDRLRVLAAIRHNCRVSAVLPDMLPAFGDQGVDLAWPNASEFAAAYRAHPDLLQAAADIAEHCSRADVLPSPRHTAVTSTSAGTAASSLRDQAGAGMLRIYGPAPSAPVRERLEHELAAIATVGQAELFLRVADIVRHARSLNIAVSTRGSVANSLVAYCLGISTVDPIAHELIFERFLNPARQNPPDIDLDFCSRRRDEVLHYVRETYGADHVALVSTVSTMQLRSAVREVVKAYGLSPDATNRLVAGIRREWHPDPRRRARQTLADLVATASNQEEAVVLEVAVSLVGMPHHLSIHPGGIIITTGPLTDIVPLELAPKGFLVTQYDHEDIEAIGLPKVDLLGIRALTVLSDAAELVRETQSEDFRVDGIPFDDPATGDLLSAAETIGVFQCESEGAQRTLRQLRARSVEDLAVASAFFKPGPATGGMARAFVLRYRGEQAVSFLHPALRPILGRTKGVLLFQEQVLRVVREIAGLSWAQADHIRRGMSKFKAEEMEALTAEFMAGCCRPAPDGPGLSADQARTLWDQVQAFAGYGFNQGHATAYADVSYRSAFIKAHWPAEFMCARLADAGGFHHQAIYIAEARRLGIRVRPPHVNASSRRFTLSYEEADEPGRARQPVLWMGLGQVRGLQRSTIAAIQRERAVQSFVTLDDFLRRVPAQLKEIESLIRAGALDSLGHSRQAMLGVGRQADRAGSVSQMAFPFAEPSDAVAETAAQRLRWESHELGLPVSVCPLDIVTRPSSALPLRDLVLRPQQRVEIDAFRLPGWTGGKGAFVSDGNTYVNVRPARPDDSALRLRAVWEPMRLSGRWIVDEWDVGWFQIEKVESLT